ARLELDVDFQSDDRFVVHHNPGLRLCQSVARSYVCATRRIVSSSNALPRICRPMGKRRANPHGTLTPQIPARLALIMKMSHRYIFSGSAVFSPILNATSAVVGVAITSHF